MNKNIVIASLLTVVDELEKNHCPEEAQEFARLAAAYLEEDMNNGLTPDDINKLAFNPDENTANMAALSGEFKTLNEKDQLTPDEQKRYNELVGVFYPSLGN